MRRTSRKKKSSLSEKAFYVPLLIVAALLVLGVGLYFLQRPQYTKESVIEKRLMEIMQENPDAEVFHPPADDDSSLEKVPTEKKSP